jgi:hypothetical protein
MQLQNRYASSDALSGLAADVEKRALFHAEHFAPTPGNLGAEGCMAEISHYVVGPTLAERGNLQAYRDLFKKDGIHSPSIQSSDFINWFKKNNLGTVTEVQQSAIRADMLKPGDIVIAEKPTDHSQHAVLVTRIPSNWGAASGALMFVGNTGRDLTGQSWVQRNLDGTPQDGMPAYPHAHLMQEAIGSPGTERFNVDHGQINSQLPTNPYRGGRFFILHINQ